MKGGLLDFDIALMLNAFAGKPVSNFIPAGIFHALNDIQGIAGICEILDVGIICLGRGIDVSAETDCVLGAICGNDLLGFACSNLTGNSSICSFSSLCLGLVGVLFGYSRYCSIGSFNSFSSSSVDRGCGFYSICLDSLFDCFNDVFLGPLGSILGNNSLNCICRRSISSGSITAVILFAAAAASGAVFFSRNSLKTEECDSNGDSL